MSSSSQHAEILHQSVRDDCRGQGCVGITAGRAAAEGISIDDAPDGKVEDDPTSATDGLEGWDEEEDCDGDNAVEEDEEEVDIDVSIAACLENKVVVQGARRSGRLAARGDMLRDARMAQLMQEQTYVDGCDD